MLKQATWMLVENNLGNRVRISARKSGEALREEVGNQRNQPSMATASGDAWKIWLGLVGKQHSGHCLQPQAHLSQDPGSANIYSAMLGLTNTSDVDGGSFNFLLHCRNDLQSRCPFASFVNCKLPGWPATSDVGA